MYQTGKGKRVFFSQSQISIKGRVHGKGNGWNVLKCYQHVKVSSSMK